ncbi:MAG: ATP-binding protein [Bacteroides sp.]|nr:ATP-binding protein [Bacteroides sp.]
METKKAPQIPYGISDFVRMRTENYYYVDKTMYLPLIEDTASYIFMIRPRRFGKSLFLSMMSVYYDILQKDRFEELFGGLWIGSNPTDQRNRFQMIYFDFSKAGASLERLEENFDAYCSIVLHTFARNYASFYDADFEEEIKKYSFPKSKLEYISRQAASKGYPLYLIIDEYDDFTNIVLSEQGKDKSRELTHVSGFYREYFKQFKGMFAHIFLMGVSPVTLDDLSSGYNIDWGISNDPRFNAMMGFSETDVRQMLACFRQFGKLEGDIDAMIEEMRPWYNNYCFAEECLNEDRVFNCDMTLYYLRHRIQTGKAPKEMVDKNIRTDYSKLRMLARLDHETRHEGMRMSTIEEIAAKGEVLVHLQTSFPADKLTDAQNFRSLLYYYGMLTICGTRGELLKMCSPNLCVREQYYGFLRDYYQRQTGMDISDLNTYFIEAAYDGNRKQLIDFIAQSYKANSSVRDAIEGERHLQGFTKAYLALTNYYLLQPELEMNYGYCDFFLLPDKQRFPDVKHSYILELKYAPRTATPKELEAQAAEGRKQLEQYAQDKKALHLAEGTTLHKLLLQFKGWELVKCEEIN